MNAVNPATSAREPVASAHSESPVCSALQAASEAVTDLRAALTTLGVTLPSVRIDLPSCTSSIDARPLVDLGRCNMETARRLITILNQAAAR